MYALFKNRAEAGQKLAHALEQYMDQSPVVLALPRGGVPVGYEIARHLKAPLDVLLVRKIGAPMAEELAAGAVVDGAERQLVLNEEVIRHYDIPPAYIEHRAAQQLEEIERRRKLYTNRPPVSVEGRTAIIVDDGIATGATVRAALAGLKMRNPERLILAVPLAPREVLEKLSDEADEVLCLATPSPFIAVGNFYQTFNQVDDREVIDFLMQATTWQRRTPDYGGMP